MTTPWSFYNEHGAEYNRLQLEFAGGQLEMDRRVMRQLFSDKGCAEGLTVEVGCGTGLDLAAWLNLGATQVVGVEPSNLRQDAERRAATLGGEVYVRPGTWEFLPVPNATARCVTARYSLHLAERLSVAFDEAARVLKPAGWLIFSVPHPEYHARLVREGKQTPDGMLISSLFGGRLPVPNPVRAHMEDYTSSACRHFDHLEHFPYSDTGVVRGDDSTPTGLICAYRRRGR